MKFLAPLFRKLGYAPIHKGMGKRSFAAAASNRLTNDWRSIGISLNSILSGDGDALRARARDLAENDETFTGFLRIMKCNIIGHCGMTLKNKAMEPPMFKNGDLVPGDLDKLANALIENDWYEWGKKENCTTSKNLSWLQVQQLALEEWVTCGETLWEMVFGPEADNRFGFALRPVVIDRMHTQSNHILSNGDRVRMGVQTNRDGRRKFYWLTDEDPTECIAPYRNQFSPMPRDASRYVHLFLPRRIDQVRGVPWAAAAMLRLKMFGGYNIATITGAEVAACKMGFLKKTGDGTGYKGEDTDDGGKFMDAEPGLLEELPQGMDVEVVDWNQPNAQYEQFTKACLRGIATALGVSYPTLANDYAEVNFSSGRMARMEEKEFWKFAQSCMTTDFHEPIFAKWLEQSLTNMAIAYPMGSGKGSFLPLSKLKKFNQPNFHGRRWDWVDPEKEVNAKVKEIRACVTSPTRVIAEIGADEDELLDEIAAFKSKAEARGLKFPDLFDDHKEAETEEGPDDFKRKAWLGFQQDGTTNDVMANLVDMGKLTKEVGLPPNTEYKEPYLPVVGEAGPVVTGEVLKDSDGDIVGGVADVGPDAKLNAETTTATAAMKGKQAKEGNPESRGLAGEGDSSGNRLPPLEVNGNGKH